ncbi:PREDICTED: oxidoreductase-like domain-containing protein 1 [Rhagoletis zephyria]|uniref:oxidoreductase-like domain-containing protein 1 n=1 Tax=Rhagoletis zephyria TaxID=28612 RepID=UPI0008116FBC|nr:PREDICTED: oxidoreductase-like domain-containing protein 1 [Rhagoletis zephyria]
MRPACRQLYNRGLLIQSTKTFLNNLLRMYGDSDIEIPPEPTTCCMSGCANCVWIEYAETLSKLFAGNDEKARQIILSKITDPNLKMFLSLELRNIGQKKVDEKKDTTESHKDQQPQ